LYDFDHQEEGWKEAKKERSTHTNRNNNNKINNEYVIHEQKHNVCVHTYRNEEVKKKKKMKTRQ